MDPTQRVGGRPAHRVSELPLLTYVVWVRATSTLGSRNRYYRFRGREDAETGCPERVSIMVDTLGLMCSIPRGILGPWSTEQRAELISHSPPAIAAAIACAPESISEGIDEAGNALPLAGIDSLRSEEVSGDGTN